MKINKRNNKRALLTGLFMTAAISAIAAEKVERISPDNTKINSRDKSVIEKTADQQSNQERDISLVRAIRQDLVKDKSLSTYAKNIKVISDLGHVTLKGPVLNADEKRKVESIAQNIAGVNFVNNQIDIVKSSRKGE